MIIILRLQGALALVTRICLLEGEDLNEIFDFAIILLSSMLTNSNLIVLFLVLIRSNAESADDDQRKPAKLSLKKKGIGSEARAERMVNADADLQLLNESERGRLLQKQKKRRTQGREDEVCHNSLIILVYHFLRNLCLLIVFPPSSYLLCLHFLLSVIVVLSYPSGWNIIARS